MVLNLCDSPSNLIDLPLLFLIPDRAYLSLCGSCSVYFPEYSFSTLHSSKECPGPCNKHVFTGRTITRVVYIIFLALYRVALLEVGWQFVFSYLSCPSITVTVGIFPRSGFIRCSSFLDLLGDLHLIGHFTGLRVGLPF